MYIKNLALCHYTHRHLGTKCVNIPFLSSCWFHIPYRILMQGLPRAGQKMSNPLPPFLIPTPQYPPPPITATITTLIFLYFFLFVFFFFGIFFVFFVFFFVFFRFFFHNTHIYTMYIEPLLILLQPMSRGYNNNNALIHYFFLVLLRVLGAFLAFFITLFFRIFFFFFSSLSSFFIFPLALSYIALA